MASLTQLAKPTQEAVLPHSHIVSPTCNEESIQRPIRISKKILECSQPEKQHASFPLTCLDAKQLLTCLLRLIWSPGLSYWSFQDRFSSEWSSLDRFWLLLGLHLSISFCSFFCYTNWCPAGGSLDYTVSFNVQLSLICSVWTHLPSIRFAYKIDTCDKEPRICSGKSTGMLLFLLALHFPRMAVL